MDLTAWVADVFGIVGFLTMAAGGLIIARASKEQKTSEVWRAEAEAQKARAERLHEDLTEVREALELKNQEIQEVREHFVPSEANFR